MADTEQVVKVSAPMLNWAGAEDGMTAPHQGSQPIVHVSLLDHDGDVKTFVLPQGQMKVVVKDLLTAMVQNGSEWAKEVLALGVELTTE